MGRNEKKYGTIGLMILTVIIIFSVVGIVIAGFRMIKKNEDARLIAPAGHSPSQVPQLIQSSEITYAIIVSSFRLDKIELYVLYSLFYTRFSLISSIN